MSCAPTPLERARDNSSARLHHPEKSFYALAGTGDILPDVRLARPLGGRGRVRVCRRAGACPELRVEVHIPLSFPAAPRGQARSAVYQSLEFSISSELLRILVKNKIEILLSQMCQFVQSLQKVRL